MCRDVGTLLSVKVMGNIQYGAASSRGVFEAEPLNSRGARAGIRTQSESQSKR